MSRIPGAGLRVGEVHDRHARLPEIGLPHAAVGPLDEVAARGALGEEARTLADVGVDPDADLESSRVETREHARRIGKHARVPLEVAPVEFAHPEAVEVEDMQRQVALLHALDELRAGRLVIVGRERGGQPEAEGPGGRQRGAAGERGQAGEDLFRRRPGDHEILQALAGDAELHARHLLRGDLEGDRAGLVDEHAVAAVRQIKRHALVGLLARGAAVLVGVLHHLAVFHEGGEALAQAVNALADAKRELLVDKRVAPVALEIAHAAPAAAGQHAPPGLEGDLPAVLVLNARGDPAGMKQGVRIGLLDTHRDARVVARLERDDGAGLAAVGEVVDAHADHALHRRAQRDRQQRALQRVAAVADGTRRRMHDESVRVGVERDVVRLRGIVGGYARLKQPLAVGEFHDWDAKG